MALRGIGGAEIGTPLVIDMTLAAGYSPSVGDICCLDTTANRTIKQATADAIPFGRIESISDGIAAVSVFGFRALVLVQVDAAIAVGASVVVKTTGTNIAKTTATFNYTMVISDPGAAGYAEVLI